MKKRKWLLQLSALNCDTSHSKTQHTCGRAFFVVFIIIIIIIININFFFLNQTKGGKVRNKTKN